MYHSLVTPQDCSKTLVYYYVSEFDISVNTTYIQYDDNLISQFWVFPFSIIEIKNSEICHIHKTFLDMLKKYSVLISQCNELAREQFFVQQHKYIDNMINDDPDFFLDDVCY
jgi:hypothetical protein